MFGNTNVGTAGRYLYRDELPSVRDQHSGDVVVLATGCFDLIHSGHVHFLEQAASQGDILILGINDDESVRSIKGKDRPILNEQERCVILAAFRFVSYIFTYPEKSAEVSIRLLGPDVFVVGSESLELYPDEIAAAKAVGSSVFPISKVASPSTTKIVETIRNIDRSAS